MARLTGQNGSMFLDGEPAGAVRRWQYGEHSSTKEWVYQDSFENAVLMFMRIAFPKRILENEGDMLVLADWLEDAGDNRCQNLRELLGMKRLCLSCEVTERQHFHRHESSSGESHEYAGIRELDVSFHMQIDVITDFIELIEPLGILFREAEPEPEPIVSWIVRVSPGFSEPLK